MSVWNSDNIIDVAESVGIGALNRDVVEQLARDVEYRIGQVIEEALKFMRHGKRTTLTTQDISQALRLLDVEPLYGYESTRPLRFGEASIGPAQSIFYIEDEEMDFEKLINAPLPKVPREMSLTAHWLAVEGVQPSIPQNPTAADQRQQELLPKGPGANANILAIARNDNVTVKPLVKHILSKELQLYFGRVTAAILDQGNEEHRSAAFASLRSDPGLHQLVPYFVQFVAEKVTHSLKSLSVLTQMMLLVGALLDNSNLHITPYVASLIPPVLTCLTGKSLGSVAVDGPDAHFRLRDLAASLLRTITKRYGTNTSTLKPRIARACLKTFLDSHKPFGAHYGAVLGLKAAAGISGIKVLLLPVLKAYDIVLKNGLDDETKKSQAEMVVVVLLEALTTLEQDVLTSQNGHPEGDELKTKLIESIGEVLGGRVFDLDRPAMISAILEKDPEF